MFQYFNFQQEKYNYRIINQYGDYLKIKVLAVSARKLKNYLNKNFHILKLFKRINLNFLKQFLTCIQIKLEIIEKE